MPNQGRVAQGTERWPSKPSVAGSNPAAPISAYTSCEGTERKGLPVQEMTVYALQYDNVGRQPIVLLRTSDERQLLPIWIGQSEAGAIMAKLRGSESARPMTHDLLQSTIELLGATVERITVTALRENTYYAQITLLASGQEVELDSRPSDAIALAVRVGAPIFAADDVIAESAVEAEGTPESEQQVVEDFRRFLDDVQPEDFQS